MKAEKFFEGTDGCGNHSKLKVVPGVWMNGKTYWMHDGEEHIHEEGVSVNWKKVTGDHIQMQEVMITNHLERPCHIKLMFKHLLMESETDDANDCLSFISPAKDVIFHLDDDHLFLIDGESRGYAKKAYTVQPFQNLFTGDIWACHRTGKLKYSPMVNGNAVSFCSFDFYFPGKGTTLGKSWIIRGKNDEELIKMNKALLKTD